MWLEPGEEGRITLRVFDDDTSNNLIITKGDGSTVSIDPAYAPTTGATPGVSSQGVGTEDKTAGKTDPPLVTPTGANLFFLQMPINGVAGRGARARRSACRCATTRRAPPCPART